jgi:DNA primase
MKTLLKIPVSDIVKKLDTAEGGKILVMDGIITQRLIDAADKVGIEYIVGHRTGELKKSTDINIITFSQMGVGN